MSFETLRLMAQEYADRHKEPQALPATIDTMAYAYQRITSREIVPTGRIFPLFTPRMTGPKHRSLLPSTALQATGKECSCSWHGYDYS